SPEMLAVLREQAPPQNLELVEATMQTLALGRRDFALAYSAFRAFQHLLTVDDQLAALTRAREHLRDDGWLALDVFDPDLARMARDEPETDDDPFEWEGRTIKRTYEVHRERATQTMQVIFRYYDVDSGAQLGREELAMRWVYRYELEHLLWRAGFEPLRWSSAYDGRPYDGRGEIVVVARRR
ncbi:MAG: class I SAM-dependent methyltransferase, partial [Myxococcales bacterium]|nr:class I SAM-dependent methyltransferase [Myxococcales bacterium]